MDSGKQSEWHAAYQIHSYDVDPSCTVRLPVLCKYMQEAAYLHAEHFGVGHSQLAPEGVSWVLARQRIEVDYLPKWGESVQVRTWPSGRDRLFYYRDFEIRQAGRLVLRASTAWFIIDITKRERILPAWWTTANYPVGEKVFDTKLARLKGCGCESGEPMVVNYGDLDQNGHVNNVRYIEWILNSLPLEFCRTHALLSIEVNFLAEALYGHRVTICTNETDPLTFDHAVRAGTQDLFRARSVWHRI